MGDVRENFIKPLARQFTLPKGAADDVKQWAGDYIDALSGYTDSLLSLAAKNVIKERESRTFPLVSECVRACCDAMDEVSQPDLRKPIQLDDDVWSSARRDKADRLFVEAEMSRAAIEEGWAWSLWDWMRVYERAPEGGEVSQLRNASLRDKMAFEEIVKNPVKPVNPYFNIDINVLKLWRDNVLKRLSDLLDGKKMVSRKSSSLVIGLEVPKGNSPYGIRPLRDRRG